MMTSFTPSDEFLRLLNGLAEEQLSEQQRMRLADILRNDKNARTYYLDYVALLTSLQWEYAEAAITSQPASTSPTLHKSRTWLMATSAAVCILVGISIWFFVRPSHNQSPGKVATLVSCTAARWESGSVPTVVGSALGVGRLRLAEGLAKIRFVRGAEITIEGPADLELRTDNECILRTGRLVAIVPKSAAGFIVDTPTAKVEDFGARFGIHVRDKATSDVLVFEGHVDITHKPSKRILKLKSGDTQRFTAEKVIRFDPDDSLSNDHVPIARNGQVVFITTAEGRGQDTYVESVTALRKRFRSDSLLLLKNSRPTRRTPTPRNRKVYLAFDLASIRESRVVDAELILTFAPSGIGFASETPDASFVAYGVTDESSDEWTEQTITWENAPANKKHGKVFSGGAQVNRAKVTRLGEFGLKQGEVHGTRNIKRPVLRKFLNDDSNGIATIIVVRETQGSGRFDLVHAIASRRHPSFTPPTLKMLVEPKN